MASQGEDVGQTTALSEDDDGSFRKEITDLKFVNISIKCYEKRAGTGFKEEYYAFKIVSILSPVSDDEDSEETSTGRTRYESFRRYSEFDFLKIFLTSVYPHVVIPPLPEKAIKGSGGLLNKITFTGEDSNFLLQRQQALEIFLVRISRHPVLSKNFWFHIFLQKVNWKEQLIHKGFSGKGESVLQSLSLQLSKRVPDSRFQEVKQYANDLDSVMKAMLEIREKMNATMKALYKVHGNYSRVFSELCVNEKTLGTGLQIASGCIDSYADSFDNYISEEESRFFLPVKEYIAFCDSLRTVVRRHEYLQRNLEKAEENLSSKAETKESLQRNNPEEGGSGTKKISFRSISARLRGEDTSYEGQLATSEKELHEAEKSVEKSQKEFEEFTNDSLAELEKFNYQKAGDFRSMLINYVQLQMHMHKKFSQMTPHIHSSNASAVSIGVTTWQKIQNGFST